MQEIPRGQARHCRRLSPIHPWLRRTKKHGSADSDIAIAAHIHIQMRKSPRVYRDHVGAFFSLVSNRQRTGVCLEARRCDNRHRKVSTNRKTPDPAPSIWTCSCCFTHIQGSRAEKKDSSMNAVIIPRVKRWICCCGLLGL